MWQALHFVILRSVVARIFKELGLGHVARPAPPRDLMGGRVQAGKEGLLPIKTRDVTCTVVVKKQLAADTSKSIAEQSSDLGVNVMCLTTHHFLGLGGGLLVRHV